MPSRLTFHLILHTHWDREWYLTRGGFQARLASVASPLIALLNQDTAARFVLDGQTVLLDDLLAVRPDARFPLMRAAHEGRLDVGPWYVLGDEQIPSGESLLRNLLEGARDSARLGGRMNVLYSPDAFGHPSMLPALAAQFGIANSAVWRGLAPAAGADRDLYRWRSPNGSEMLLYHFPAQGYEIGADLLAPGPGLTARWRAIRNGLVARAAGRHVAVFAGADHHAPPREIAPILRRLQALEPAHEFRVSTLSEFFTAASASYRAFPSIAGELRASYGHTWTLQGVHATRARMKRRHSRAEMRLARIAEPLAALAAWQHAEDRRGVLREAWRTLLQCQFHDTLGGCCSDGVAAEQDVRLDTVQAMCAEIVRGAWDDMSGHDPDAARRGTPRGTPALLTWNPVPRERDGIVVAEVTCFRRDVLVGPPSGRKPRTGPGFTPFALIDSSGGLIPVQVLGIRSMHERLDASRHYPDQDEVDRVWVAFDAPSLGGLGSAKLVPRQGVERPRARGLEIRNGGMANRYLVVRVSRTGTISIEDRQSGERFANLMRLEDEQDLGDTYSVFVPPSARVSTTAQPVSQEVLASGPLLGAIETRWNMKAATRGTIPCRLVTLLHADSPLLRLRLEIDHRAVDHRLRARIPVRAGHTAIAGAAFGFERRPQVEITPGEFPAETPVRTAPAHRFVAAGEGRRGLAVLAPGFFEYEWTAGQDIVFTVLRAVGELSRDTLPTRPGHAGWPMPVPGAQELGTHVMELALALVSAPDIERPHRLEQLWEDVFLPIQGRFIRDFSGSEAALARTGIALEGSGLVFSACKPAETGTGLVLRCYNATDSVVQGRWVFARSITGATMLWADEREMGALRLRNPRRVEFTAGPRQFVTVMVAA